MRIKIIHIIVFWLMLIFTASAAEKSWDGKWHVFWKHGAIVMTLEQHGNDVNGSYKPTHGTVKGHIEDNKLHAVTINENGQSNVTLIMGQTGSSFFGNTKSGDWITGIKVDADSEYNTLSVDDSSPMHTFYSFLKLGNQVRSGHYEALEKALNLLYMDENQKKYFYGKRLALTRMFFKILDACTVEKHAFNRNIQSDYDSVILHQVGTTNTVEIEFIKVNYAEGWKISIPTMKQMEETLISLMSAREQHEYNSNENLKLKTPRDTIRTFIEQYKRWKKNGKAYVISTMNLSAVDPAIWDWQAPLLSHYLLGVIDRISEIVYQEIPNDPKSKKPYVHFHHPLGDIVIAPYEVDGQTRWQFTSETLETIEILFEEMEDIPLKVSSRMISENDLYFTLKNIAQSISPLLIKKFYDTAFWQIALLALLIFLAGWISYFTKWITLYIVKKYYLTKRWTDQMITVRFLRPVQILTFGLLLLYGAHQLGLSDFLFSIIKTISHLMIVIGIAWIIFSLIDIIISLLKIRAKRHASEVDEIFLSIISSILRIGVVLVAIFAVAEILGVPYKTVVAGLGIGGLAFAIAAKDTIANFFGSAIIIADRPFKTGDKIKIGSDIGVITNVGIRSTKIRTIFDTVLTVPNNKITSEMIDNYTAREAMRIDTEFFLSLQTSKESLDKLDSDILKFLTENEGVDNSKIILTGVNDFTKRGISFGLSFFVKASTDMEYSNRRHRIVTDIAQIIKENNIELIMVNQEYVNEK
ncbi:mechanosensitive ion channel family protein [Sulfurovum sp. CS9]|uniref:mechanosensitive ion channel family protein n=1 Tax=Sulfurovum sp. CS9 TaxID=3391146 RepID=UPI0039EA5162